jgi:predicted GNAT family acetyltransferase
MTVEVTDAPGQHRYEVSEDGVLAGFTVYVDRPDGRAFVHTEIDPAFEGRGLAARLVRHAMDAEAAAGRAVVPECPYVRHWLERHPDHPVSIAG